MYGANLVSKKPTYVGVFPSKLSFCVLPAVRISPFSSRIDSTLPLEHLGIVTAHLIFNSLPQVLHFFTSTSRIWRIPA